MINYFIISLQFHFCVTFMNKAFRVVNIPPFHHSIISSNGVTLLNTTYCISDLACSFFFFSFFFLIYVPETSLWNYFDMFIIQCSVSVKKISGNNLLIQTVKFSLLMALVISPQWLAVHDCCLASVKNSEQRKEICDKVNCKQPAHLEN